jgi:hypothetical protein
MDNLNLPIYESEYGLSSVLAEQALGQQTEFRYYPDGDILTSGADLILIPVNTVGVPGAGLAKQWADKYPEQAKVYKDACKPDADSRLSVEHPILIGARNPANRDHFLYKDDFFFWMFPTKNHYREQSTYKMVHQGLIRLRSCLDSWNEPGVIAIPKLGCGLGGLDWFIVRLMILKALSGTTHCIELFGEDNPAPGRGMGTAVCEHCCQ